MTAADRAIPMSAAIHVGANATNAPANIGPVVAAAVIHLDRGLMTGLMSCDETYRRR